MIKQSQPDLEPAQAFEHRFPDAKLMVVTNHFMSEAPLPMTNIEEIHLLEVPPPDTLPFFSLGSDPESDGAEPVSRLDGAFPLPAVEPMAMQVEERLQLVSAAVVDRSALFRAGLMHILAKSRFCVTAECARLSDLPDQALGDEHCVVLIGLDKDAETALQEIAVLKGRHPDLHMIVLSEQLYPDLLLAAIEAGADGYLLKNEIGPDGLLKSMELVLVEGVVVPHGFTKMLSSRVQPTPQLQLNTAPTIQQLEPVSEIRQWEPVSSVMQAENRGRLSTREHLILTHLTQGASNKYIARELNIAEATVKVHVKSLLRKIRVNNRTQAAMWAINHVPPIGRPDVRPFDTSQGEERRTASGN